MKPIKFLTLTGALLLSAAAMAESGGDKAFEKMMQNNRVAMENYAAKQGKNPPQVREYAYGMQLDVVNVVSVTPPIKSCGVVPAQMTYEDSSGELNTLRYNVAGECRTHGG
ncbi:DUF2790 domain-containing protein [Pseudomonas sp. Irchel s3h17]|uniref:DUF2790 domain-containing protein n=1 Tax=Pseudomonas sp. Irchel s3h17 TaxID=2009182 RepID=UPI000BA349F8|nr:DUF2790 domain-containing protein [Pseudomonas sp. Irchel s3h17]